MADTKISNLSSASTPLAGTEVLPIVQSGATVKSTVDDLTAGRVIPGEELALTGGRVQLSAQYVIETRTVTISDTAAYTSVVTCGTRGTFKVTFAGQDASSGIYGAHISEAWLVSSNDTALKPAINVIYNYATRGADVQWSGSTFQVKPQNAASNIWFVKVEIMSSYCNSNAEITWLV